MFQFFDELNHVINSLSLTNDEVIIVGSSAITAIGGRKNNDIEFSVNKEGIRKLNLKIRLSLLIRDHIDLTENVDLFKNRYLCLGIKDKSLFNDGYYTMIDGYRVVIPEIEFAYKKIKNREKDRRDFLLIKENKLINDRIDYKVVDQILCRKIEKRYVYFVKCRDLFWRIMRQVNDKRRKTVLRDGTGKD